MRLPVPRFPLSQTSTWEKPEVLLIRKDLDIHTRPRLFVTSPGTESDRDLMPVHDTWPAQRLLIHYGRLGPDFLHFVDQVFSLALH